MKLEFKYGLIIGLFGFLNVILEYLPVVKPMGNVYFNTIWALYFLIPLVFYFFVVYNKRKALGGQMLWVEGARLGAYVALLGALITLVCMILYFTIINPNFFTSMIQYAVEQGMDKKSALINYSFTTYLYFAFLRSIMLGVVFSALAALVLKKQPSVQ